MAARCASLLGDRQRLDETSVKRGAVAPFHHRGSAAQVWDAIVTATTPVGSRQIAVFCCTQMLLEARDFNPSPTPATDER